MITACVFGLVLTVPQLRVEPSQVEAGQPFSLRVENLGAPLAGITVQVGLPDGERIAAPATDVDGRTEVATSHAGRYVFSADLEGTRLLAVANARAPGPRWPLALACVPLGLALLWRELTRARGRRGSPPTACPGSQ